jgi:transcriptional regulator with XRE-family HTH domain
LNHTVGMAIKRERELVGVTQVELAESAGVSRELLAQYESGLRRVPESRAAAIAEALGVSVARLHDNCAVQRFIREQPDRRYVRRPKFNTRHAFAGA